MVFFAISIIFRAIWESLIVSIFLIFCLDCSIAFGTSFGKLLPNFNTLFFVGVDNFLLLLATIIKLFILSNNLVWFSNNFSKFFELFSFSTFSLIGTSSLPAFLRLLLSFRAASTAGRSRILLSCSSRSSPITRSMSS